MGACFRLSYVFICLLFVFIVCFEVSWYSYMLLCCLFLMSVALSYLALEKLLFFPVPSPLMS